jgi:hypothetical protein
MMLNYLRSFELKVIPWQTINEKDLKTDAADVCYVNPGR